jgi:hypothetical protein
MRDCMCLSVSLEQNLNAGKIKFCSHQTGLICDIHSLHYETPCKFLCSTLVLFTQESALYYNSGCHLMIGHACLSVKNGKFLPCTVEVI